MRSNWILLLGMILISSSYLIFKLIRETYFTNEYYFMSTCAGGALISTWIIINSKSFPKFYKKFSINFLVYFNTMLVIFSLDYGFEVNTLAHIYIICLITALCTFYLILRYILKYVPPI